MKRIISILVAGILALMSCFSLTGCGAETQNDGAVIQDDLGKNTQLYDDVVINTEFYYSSDDGMNYRPEAKRFTVGTPMLMKIIIKAAGTKFKSKTVHGTITIPNDMNIDFLDAKGATVTDGGALDLNVSTYDFEIQANFVSTSAINQVELIFAFTPKEEAKHTITATFDDQVAPKYDRTHSVLFVASETDDWE